MAEFGYVVSLRLQGRLAVVVGGGGLAAGRVADLLDAGAHVRVVTPHPSESLLAHTNRPDVTVVNRRYERGDLAGAAIAIATGENPFDADAFWAESRAAGVLAQVLDDLDRCDFAAPALVRRGDLRVAVATAGRAPALAKRLRRWLDDRFGQAWGELVDVLGDVREAAGPRGDVPFREWSGRWEAALDDVDGLVGLVAAGHRDAVFDHVLAHLRPNSLDTGPDAALAAEGPS